MDYDVAPFGGWKTEIKNLLSLNKNLTRQYNLLFKRKVEEIKISPMKAYRQALFIAQKNGKLWLKILPELRKRNIDPISMFLKVERETLKPKKTSNCVIKKRDLKISNGRGALKVKCIETGEVFPSVYSLKNIIGYDVSYYIRNNKKINGKTYVIMKGK